MAYGISSSSSLATSLRIACWTSATPMKNLSAYSAPAQTAAAPMADRLPHQAPQLVERVLLIGVCGKPRDQGKIEVRKEMALLDPVVVIAGEPVELEGAISEQPD